jgi:hypothetical protein
MQIENNGETLLLFSGKIIRRSGALAFRGPLAQFFLTVKMGKTVWLQKISEHEEVFMGVKAKSIQVEDGSTTDTVYFWGDVEKQPPDEFNEHVYVKIGTDRVRINTESKFDLKDGDVIRLQFNRTDAVLFRYPTASLCQGAG